MLRRLVSSIPVEPSLEVFAGLAEKGNIVPVYTQLAADFETPLSAYLKLRDNRHSFLLESAASTSSSAVKVRVFEPSRMTMCSPRSNARWLRINR